jgi:D-lactate dehydrogenase (cytochrome)
MKRGVKHMNWLNELQTIIPKDRVSTNPTVLERHSKDESYHTPHLPDVVVFPISTEEVSKILVFAHRCRVPVVPFGVGTSLEGHVIPVQGGISIDFHQMNKIIEIRPQDFLVKVQPGVTRIQLNQELKKHGLFFTVDPGADATLGGMAATNASGTTAVRYGVMRDQVRGLEVVLADGTVIHTGGMAAKSSAGYSLTNLFVGSEGTLGMFTELTLRVYGIPETIMAVRASFPTIEKAINTANSILSAGIPVARMEFLDDRSMKQVNKYNQLDYQETPNLFLEFHGNEAGLNQDVQFAKELADEQNCTSFEYETDSLQRAKLWEARHQLAYAFIHGYPQRKHMSTDVCLPLSELVGAIQYTHQLLDESNLPGGILGHVGDGNYHTILMMDLNDPLEKQRTIEMNEKIVKYAIERGGTCTGEHGIGIGKSKYLPEEHGPGLMVMKQIKDSLDPLGILNPGKIFPKE